MANYTKQIVVVLLITGTLGLLMNEFLLDWGRSGTLFFAALNMIGLVILGFSYWRENKET